MKIREAMHTGCNYVAPTDSVLNVAKMMAQNDFGVVPIAENDKLIGILTDRDMVVRGIAQGVDMATTQVRDLMSDDVYYCYDDQDCDEVAANMGQMQVRRMPVVDRNKQLVGMLSLGDLATHGLGHAAEIALEGVSRHD